MAASRRGGMTVTMRNEKSLRTPHTTSPTPSFVRRGTAPSPYEGEGGGGVSTGALSRREFLGLAGTALGASLLAGCGSGGSFGLPPGGTYFAGSVAVGNGVGTVFVTLDNAAKPAALGVRLTAAALTNLPNTDTEYILALPPQAAGSGFDHVGLDWNPQGHPPPGVYDVPHFDVHFYQISQAQRNAITAVGADRDIALLAPPASAIPTDYVPTTDPAPTQGTHWIDPTAPEFHGQPFTVTFIYGFYNGQMVFVEPMVTKAFLDSRASFTAAVKQPATYPRPGYYPTQYSVRYDA